MTHPGADPRRRRVDSSLIGSSSAISRQPVRAGRQVGRSSLWAGTASAAGPTLPAAAVTQGGSGTRVVTASSPGSLRADAASLAAHGPQPLRASWTPVPEGALRRRPGSRSAPVVVSPSARSTTARPSAAQRRQRSGAAAAKHRSAVGWFVHHYGWRAYALPFLVAVTVAVLLQAFRPAAPVGAAAGATVPTVPLMPAVGAAPTTVTVASIGPTTTVVATQLVAQPAPSILSSVSAAPTPLVVTGPNPTAQFGAEIEDGELPPGATFVAKGKGTFHLVRGATKPVGAGPEKFTYTVEVEDGIQDAQADREFAHSVDSTLADSRSWIATGKFTLQRIDSGNPSFRVTLTSQLTLRGAGLCMYSTPLESSCYRRAAGRVIINNARWARGAVAFNGDIGSYRVYAINHEVGHALGFQHQPCGQNGGLAPVMMQQSFSTSNDHLYALDPQGLSGDVRIPEDHKVCRFNPYPKPLGPGS